MIAELYPLIADTLSQFTLLKINALILIADCRQIAQNSENL